MFHRHCAPLILAAIVTLALAVSCGSSTPASPTAASSGQIHALPLTVMITETGPLPREVTVAVGETVAFMNHDMVPHSVAGGSEPAKRDCPEIDAVGVLMPGETRSTLPFATARTCEYHDPRVSSATFKGRIAVR